MHEELLAIMRRAPKTEVFVKHDVRGAVYLADRIAAMTARPGPIKELCQSKSQLQHATIMLSAEYRERVYYLWRLVRDEAIRAHRSGD